MIYYCEGCGQYWTDGYKPLPIISNWSYCTIDGIEIKDCPVCGEEEVHCKHKQTMFINLTETDNIVTNIKCIDCGHISMGVDPGILRK